MSREEEGKFKLDIKDTLLRNFLWIPMFVIITSFAFMGINQVPLIENENLKVMFLVFTLFFTLKLFTWVGHPTIVLREKEAQKNDN